MRTDRLRPQCRGAAYGTDESAGPHDAHDFFPHTMSGPVRCRGWSAAEAGATAMLDALDEAMRPFRPTFGWEEPGIPAGLHVECHPSVPAAIRKITIPSFASYREHGEPSDADLIPVPLAVDPSMPYGAWRLVLAQGEIPREEER